MALTNDLNKLIENCPLFLQSKLQNHVHKDQLIEIILDLGRRPEARFLYGPEYLSQKTISFQDLDYLIKQISQFNNDNRAGIERTLHRISCIRNRQFLINGLTCRIGRSVFGTISGIRDLLQSNKSILILGKPGVGKTTIIREIARVLADEMEKRVIIIDTSNEIAGNNDIPHLGIGRARRMQVPNTEFQDRIMIEAVENHMPEVIIIDEIGTELEILAARTIAEKGVQLVGTTHGNYLKNLIKNPMLSNLIGGIQSVTLSDEEAKRRGTQKTILERTSYPAFEILIEINDLSFWTIHENVKTSVDSFLKHHYSFKQSRSIQLSNKIEIKCDPIQTLSFQKLASTRNSDQISWNLSNNKIFFASSSVNLVIYSYCIPIILLQEVFNKLGFKVHFTQNLKKASFILGLKKPLTKNSRVKTLAKKLNIPLYSLNQISIYQLTKFIKFIN